MIYELPPIARGDEKQQIKDLRDYLVRLVNKLNQQEASQSTNNRIRGDQR